MADDMEIVESDELLDPPNDPVLDDEEAEVVDKVSYNEDDPNLVEAFAKSVEGKKELKRISEFVMKEFDAAWDSQEGYRKRVAADHQLFVGELPAKEFPFDKMANPHVPMMLENITRITMRIESEVFGDWSNVAGVLPIGPDDKDVADMLTRHCNYQVSEQLTDFKRQMKRGLLRFIKDGDVVCHSYWDAAKRRNRHEILTTDEFITPHVHSTVEPDFSDCPWVAKILYRYKHDLQKMRDEWYDVDAVIDGKQPAWDDDPGAPLREEVQSENEVDSDGQVAPFKLIHWEGWLELPEQVDDRYCKVVIDYASKNILQLQILEEEDWQDKHRFQKQLGDLEQYRQQKSLSDSFLAAQQAMPMNSEPGLATPPMPMMEPPMPPITPDWVEDPAQLEDPSFAPKPPRKVPIYMFSHGVCIEPLAGALGMGFGKMQADHNRAANTLLAQFIDQATLGNMKTFIAAGGVSFDKPFQMAPGRVNVAKGTTPRDLKDAFMPVDVGQANPQMVELVDRIASWAQSSMQAPDVLSGESGKSGETYRGISTRVEQATKQLSVVAGAFAQFLTQVLKNNAKLNAKFLDDEEVLFVNNHKLGTSTELRIGRRMYERDYRVMLRSDLRFASQQQRITEADQTLQMVMSIPPLANDIPMIQQALKETLVARSQDALVPFLGPLLSAPTTPLGLPPPPQPGQPGMPGAPGMGPPPGPPPQQPSAPPEGAR